MAKADQNDKLEKLATTLADVVYKTYNEMGRKGLRDHPEIRRVNIMEYEGKLWVSGMDKFNEATFVSAVSFYADEAAKAKENGLGTVVLYIDKARAPEVLKNLDYRGFDDENDESVGEQCGEFCQTVCEKFKAELPNKSIVISEPRSYLNDVTKGFDFSPDQYIQYEITFLHEEKGERALVFELTMGSLS